MKIKKYTWMYRIVLPIYGVLWRIGRAISMFSLNTHFRRQYRIEIFRLGCGLHYKFVFTRKSDNMKFLVKATDNLIEWWQDVVFQWKKESGIPLDYPSRSFSTIADVLCDVLKNPELRKITLLDSLNHEKRMIWYRFASDKKNLTEESHCRQIAAALWNKMEAHGFIYVDKSLENIVFDGNDAYLVDMESVMFATDRWDR